MNNKKVMFLTQAAMIAALYVVLTFIANAFGLDFYCQRLRSCLRRHSGAALGSPRRPSLFYPRRYPRAL